ncbi:restriction endonuclease subunit S [uncultured Draconibacterium sp.]|uniref:restriction endonuclease subunit S n=1 Tax=uncultured Draconibacterium sp. TaxID=1573823 RepID=UPI0032179555
MSSVMREDWLEVELQDVFETVTGNTPSKKEIDNYGQEIPFIKPPDITNSAIKSISEYLSNKGKLKARVLPSNSVLITCIGNLGRVGFNKDEVAFNQQINAILPTGFIDFKFTFYQAQSGSFRNQLESLSTSTTVALVNKSSFNSVRIKLAPLPIQRAIVSKIEALFSDLDNGIANFKTAQAQLKIYRQAVLKKAFEGKLSELGKVGLKDDRIIEEEILKSNNPKNPNSDNLPKGWKWVKLGEVIEKPKYGTSKKCDYNNGNVGVLRIPNISNGYIDDSDLKFAEFSSAEISDYSLNEGDILTIRSNGSVDLVGKCALIKKSDVKYLYAGYLIRLRPIKDFLNSSYLLYLMFSVALRVQIESFAKSTSGVNNINSGELSNLIIPIPPTIAEQTQIVQEIESRLSVCDKVEQSISESLIKAEALRQSILKKAFEGKLLSEAEIEQCKKEADYEPASGLLTRIERSRNEKIKAEKLAKEQEQKKATTKKKSKK